MKPRPIAVAVIALLGAFSLTSAAGADDAPAPAQTPQSPPQNPPKAVAGWLVDIMPYVKEGKSFRLLTLGLPSAEVSMGAHNAVRPLAQNVWHHGSAQLNIYKAGEYGFSLWFNPSQAHGWIGECFTRLKIGGSPVFDAENSQLSSDVREVNGSIELMEGNYDITYDVGCRRVDDPASFQKNTVYTVQILGPDDNLPRFFKPDELFTVKAK